MRHEPANENKHTHEAKEATHLPDESAGTPQAGRDNPPGERARVDRGAARHAGESNRGRNREARGASARGQLSTDDGRTSGQALPAALWGAAG